MQYYVLQDMTEETYFQLQCLDTDLCIVQFIAVLDKSYISERKAVGLCFGTLSLCPEEIAICTKDYVFFLGADFLRSRVVTVLSMRSDVQHHKRR